MKKELLIILALALLSYPALRYLLQSGGYTSHDLTHHIVRQISMDKLLSEGQFPPRWSGELNNGYGYPVFLFNYPLPAIVGQIFHLLGLNYLYSVKAVLFVSMIGSALGMYLFLKRLLGLTSAAFLGSMFYLYAPVRFLNVYVSAAVGSALAALFVPLVFWSITEGNILLGGLSLAGLILSHNVTTLIFLPVFLIFSLLLRGQLKKTVAIFLLGFGLSAWFWLPAIIEKQYIIFDSVFGNFYKDQFINFSQLIRSSWGYGLSHPQNPEPGDMSYQLGLVHIAVIFLSLVLVVFRWKTKEVRMIGGFSLAFFFLSIFMMLKNSLFLWQSLPLLTLIQFPLRFSIVAVFCASIAAGLLVKYVPFRKLLVISLLFLVIYANRNHWRINEKFDPGEDYYLSLKTTSASFNEHLPKWGRAMPKKAISKLEFASGSGQIKVLEEKSNKFSAEVESTESVRLRFNQFYFPGWEIKIDGQKTSFNYLEKGDNYGLPVFNIDSGKHQIQAQFKNTRDRNIADFISAASSALLIGLFIKNFVLRYRK